MSRRKAALRHARRYATVRAGQDRRSQAAADHELRGRQASDASVAVFERQDLDDPRVGEPGRLLRLQVPDSRAAEPLLERLQALLDQLRGRGRGVLTLALGPPKADVSGERVVPGADGRHRDERVVRHGSVRAPKGLDFLRAVA